MLGRPRRLALLAERSFTPRDGKTAVGVLRYRPGEVAAVIDSERAGLTAGDCVGVGGAIPVVGDIGAAAARGADALLIGIAPQGGDLPEAWRPILLDALARGWDVISGLHVFLADDPELAARAASSGARLLDVRRPPLPLRVAARRAAEVDALVVLTVGSDCNVGKMTTALELERALRAKSVRAEFVATGQTGIMIADRGIAVDAAPSDFVAGAIEALVLEAAAAADVVIVEGQGALHHPAYSGVTLGLIHGACPAALVLCHWAGRERMRFGAAAELPIPPLAEVRAAAEIAAGWLNPATTVALSINTLDLAAEAAREACVAAGQALGLPATDPIRFGADPIADAIVRALERRRARSASAARGTAERRHET